MEKKQYSKEFLARVYGAYMPKQLIKGTKKVGINNNASSAYVVSLLNDNWKLPLTPLSKITDEHAIYIAQNILGYVSGYKEYFIETGKRYLSKNNNYLSTDIEVVDYLRSQGYDCGYGDIPSLIKSGIAIEKQ